MSLCEIGSELNDQRQHLNRLMEQIGLGQVRRLIVAHQDRLVRFGFEWFAAVCARHGTGVLMVNGGDDTLAPDRELVHALHSIVGGFRPRCHGLRADWTVVREAAVHQDPAPGERGCCRGPGVHHAHPVRAVCCARVQ